jgi:alpha-D-ribose 1-methylphosphonate 5-triphosphate synthase subunit PhnL
MDPGSDAPRVGTADLVQSPINERHVAKRRLKARARMEARGLEARKFYQRVWARAYSDCPDFCGGE